MFRYLIPVSLVLATLSGCSGSRSAPAASDPAQAKQALVQTLDGWRSGVKPESIPETIVSDTEWKNGSELVSHQLQGEGETFGSGLRYTVLLEVRSAGATQKKFAQYLVGTSPRVSVVRTDPND